MMGNPQRPPFWAEPPAVHPQPIAANVRWYVRTGTQTLPDGRTESITFITQRVDDTSGTHYTHYTADALEQILSEGADALRQARTGLLRALDLPNAPGNGRGRP